MTDRPFAETKEQLAGYHILDCTDIDEATAKAKIDSHRLPREPWGGRRDSAAGRVGSRAPDSAINFGGGYQTEPWPVGNFLLAKPAPHTVVGSEFGQTQARMLT